MKKMDALEFYKSHEYAPLPDIGDLVSLTVEEICELMEQYHQSKVNNGVLDDVSVLFLYEFVNEFTDTEIPIEAIKETLDRLNKR